MRQQQATAYENEYFFKKVSTPNGKTDRLCVRRVLKGTSRAPHAHDALPSGVSQ